MRTAVVGGRWPVAGGRRLRIAARLHLPVSPSPRLPVFPSLFCPCIVVFFSAALAAEEPAEDPTAQAAVVVPMDIADEPLDTVAPASQFTVPDSEELWSNAYQRTQTPGLRGGFFDASQFVGEGFRSAQNFHSERYSEDDNGCQLQVIIAADEAVKDGSMLLLTKMRLTYFIPESAPANSPGAAPQAKSFSMIGGTKAKKHSGAPKSGAAKTDPPGSAAPKQQSKKGAPPGGESPLGDSIAAGGQMVVTAPRAEINVETNEGRAWGNIDIEIFPKPEPDKLTEHIAILTTEKLRWRSWGEPSLGSTEFVMYACAEKPGDPDPPVTGNYVMTQPNGTKSTVNIWGLGMIYEMGSFDRPSPVYDDDDRRAGLSTVAGNRAIFHNEIRMEMTASVIKDLMPFQPPAAQKKGDAAGKPKPDSKQPVEPERTLVRCKGPAILNMAAVSRQKTTEPDSENPEKPVVRPSEDALVLMGRRFEFLNNVSMVKTGVDDKEPAPGEPDKRTRMSCGHLRIQYPPGSMPGPTTFPEYAEAIGGVLMFGYNTAAAVTPGAVAGASPSPLTPGPAEPFSVVCERMYIDGPNDNMFLVGGKSTPAEVKESKGEASASQFNYRRNTQTLTMPAKGHKRMIIHPQAAAPAGTAGVPPATGAAGASASPVAGMMAGGDTILNWDGPLFREIRRLPVPRAADRVKEVLTLRNNVQIERPTGGLKMIGDYVRIFRDLTVNPATNKPTNQIEFLEGIGNADVSMNELQAMGETVTAEMAYDEKGELTKNVITVIGNRSRDLKATVFKGGGTAVRADKFVIDRQADTFRAFGGAVAVVKAPASPPASGPSPAKSDAAQAASGLFSGVQFDSGGNLFLQCDGEFFQNGAEHKITITKNVLIRQPGMQLIADEVYLILDDAPPPATPAPQGTPTPGGGLFSGSGDLKSIDCRGNIEITSDDKLVHCDRMFRDMKADYSLLEVNDPENDVRIYLHEDTGATKVLLMQKNLKIDSKTGTFTPYNGVLIIPYRGAQPAARDAEHSPVKRKKAAQ